MKLSRKSGNSRRSWAQSSAEAISRTCPWQRTGTTTVWSQSCASSTRPRPAGIRPTVFGAFTGTDHPLATPVGVRIAWTFGVQHALRPFGSPRPMQSARSASAGWSHPRASATGQATDQSRTPVTTKRPPRLRRLHVRAAKGRLRLREVRQDGHRRRVLASTGQSPPIVAVRIGSDLARTRGAERTERRHQAGECRRRLLAGFAGVKI